ncbi:MAG TPA: exonuclease subunit SbcD [Flavobacteriaceae bacterium]|nr:exonuclease subunit SbcD [Flavobacteriaceae bacterium]
MKILHTADWHIGKKLHKHSLYPDFAIFIDWFCQLVDNENIDVVVISGDIFDLANPSAEARQQYFDALVSLHKLGCTIIVTGGNHDSPSMLNAPKELLKSLNVHVIGALPEKMEDCLIPLYKNGEIKYIVAAIPYLRDSNLHTATQSSSYEERLEAMRTGIANIYKQAAETAAAKYPEIPCIAMGHLFAAGVTTSESERDIQIGNNAMFNAFNFDSYFSYVALGHIHKPQKVSSNIPTYYSGSPLALSFSERTDNKRVLLIDTEVGWDPKSISIPSIRKLLLIQGNMEEIEEKLEALENHSDLPSLLEVELVEEQHSPQKTLRFQAYIEAFDKEGFIIVKDRVRFTDTLDTLSEVMGTQHTLEDLTPKDVFTSLLDQQDMDEESKNMMLASFHEILESLES